MNTRYSLSLFRFCANGGIKTYSRLREWSQRVLSIRHHSWANTSLPSTNSGMTKLVPFFTFFYKSINRAIWCGKPHGTSLFDRSLKNLLHRIQKRLAVSTTRPSSTQKPACFLIAIVNSPSSVGRAICKANVSCVRSTARACFVCSLFFACTSHENR